MSEDAEIEPRTFATLALPVRHSTGTHSARSHPLLTNTVSLFAGADLPIHMIVERLRGSRKDDERGPLSIHSSLVRIF